MRLKDTAEVCRRAEVELLTDIFDRTVVLRQHLLCSQYSYVILVVGRGEARTELERGIELRLGHITHLSEGGNSKV